MARPNVILVLTDDQGYGDLGCTGNPIIQTPNLDAFYRESVRFTDYHVGPTCAPTRAGLFTGHYANSTGVWHTIGGRSLLRRDEWTLASALAGAGYRTALFGKWHLGDAYPYRPQDRGFQTTIVHGGGGISQTPDYWGNDYFNDTYLANGEPRRFEGYCTDVWFREALRFIEAHRGEPFFCAITTNAPHSPFNVEDRYADLYRGKVPEPRARFYGMIANIDENFGLLRARLEEWGLADDTILVFMTDNGTSCGASQGKGGFIVDGYNAGMRGIKGSPYDGGHRVPFFLRWPGGGFSHGRNVNRLTSHIDFMPTILELCGVEVPPSRTFHGRSLVPLLRGEEEGWPERAIVTDSQRVARPVKWRQSAVMTERWRLVNGTELYDIKDDPGQRRDVSPEHPDVVARLRDEYEAWWELVSWQFDETVPIEITGSRPTHLTAHDWRNDDCDCPWNQGHIRAGHRANGYWEIDVRDAGLYLVELRRWPPEAKRAITAGIEGDDVAWRRECVAERDWSLYTGGQALRVREARLAIGGREYRAEVRDGDEAVSFRVRLERGEDRLSTWFTGDGDLEIGAYYVSVRPG